MDFSGINYDYNDNVYLITQHAPATRPRRPRASSRRRSRRAGSCSPGSATPTRSPRAYNVYRSLGPGGGFEKVNATPFSDPQYLDTTAPPGATYYYKVTALDDWGGETDLRRRPARPRRLHAPAARVGPDGDPRRRQHHAGVATLGRRRPGRVPDLPLRVGQRAVLAPGQRGGEHLRRQDRLRRVHVVLQPRRDRPQRQRVRARHRQRLPAGRRGRDARKRPT